MKQSHVLLTAAITCAGGFFLGLMIGGYQARRTLDSQMVPVVVVAEDLPAGTLINDPEKQLKRVSFPVDSLPIDAVQNPEELRGKVLGRTLFRGSPATREALSKSESLWGRYPPPGVLVMTIRVGEGASPKILPGCYVDILIDVTPENHDPRRTLTKTIVERVMVLGWDFQRSAPGFVATLTIAVTKEQAEKLTAPVDPQPFIVRLRRPVECQDR
jgi:Flp pilus assembly protein CpaB